MPEYQPRWVGGREVGEGIRKAAPRYEAIAAELTGHTGFSVLDLGAYNAYFSLRLAEDFDARCTAVDDYRGLPSALAQAADSRVTGIYRRLTPESLAGLGDFDVILCLSVLHHVPWWRAMLEMISEQGRVLFIETATANEVLPKARAHCPEIPAAVEDLAGRIICRSHGYKSKKQRPLRVVGSLG
ncbi:methyltransferase domain-containing protein [Streptomyces sp. HNM0663]|uniref:Methyltransferase domain-containing protein n=1 Tax=Streptomyces chengmaiensis TaxID=3040919 RepID=A0ABT6HUC5_9ACTN|nr:methyltransferase domain-containing protein [Streptomyces chengmaiensis]MDH2392321.1 methyltransferase domain-containing protein [Streptomyces chengmaiensis]